MNEGQPQTLGEFREFNGRRATSGLDAKEGQNVYVISGSAVGGGGAGGGDPTTVRSGTIALFASGIGLLTAGSGSLDPNARPLHVFVVSGSIAGAAGATTTTLSGSVTQVSQIDNPVVARVSGETIVARVSGETVIAKVSGETFIAKVSGETVVARVSGQTVVVSVSGQQVEAHIQSGAVELYASGMGRITAKSGALDPTTIPLHVLVVSGSVAGTGGGDPTTVRSGTTALFASGMGLLTAKSGSLDPNANPLHVLVISGSVLGTATAGDPTTVRSGTTALFASGMGLLTAKSGALDPNTNPLHVLVVSGSVAGTGGGDPTTVRSGTIALFASGMGLLTARSGSLDPNASPLHVLPVSGGVINAFLSGQVVRVQTSGERMAVTTLSGSIVSMSGQVVYPRAVSEPLDDSLSNQMIQWQADIGGPAASVNYKSVLYAMRAGSGDSGVWDRLRTVLALSGKNPLSGDIAIGLLAIGLVSGFNTVVVSGQTVYAQVSGQRVFAEVSGQPVGVSGATVYLAASGMGQLTSRSGSLDPNVNPLHVLVISGSVLGTATAGDPTTVRSGTIALFASGMGLITAKSGALDPNTIPLHVLVVSGSVAGTGGGDPTSVRSGTIALFASGMGLLTAASGSLDPNMRPLHVFVVSGSIAGTGGGGDPTTVRSGTIALFASGMGLLTARSGSLDPNANPLHVFVISGSVVGGGAAGATNISGQTAYVGIHVPLSQNAGGAPTSGAEELLNLGSGEQSPVRLSQQGRQLIRVGRSYHSGYYARYATTSGVHSGGDTIILTPGSGRSLRIADISDAYMGWSGEVRVGYRFTSGLFFRHMLKPSVPQWGHNLIGGAIQGGIAEALRINLFLGTSGASFPAGLGSGLGVEYTVMVEEVGSGDIL